MTHELSIDEVDPPIAVITAGAQGDDRAPVDTAGTGGSAGFSHRGTAWDVMAGQPELMTDLKQFMEELDESPDLRAAATLRTLSRIRGEMERIPETCSMTDPVELQLQDVVVLMRQVLSRLR